MKIQELKKQLSDGALSTYTNIYTDTELATGRFLLAIDRFAEYFGEEGDVALFSVPGRSEISGNHTDHNRGKVLCGAVDRDIIAVAKKNDDGVIRFKSEGYDVAEVDLSLIGDTENFKKYTSHALVGGMAAAFSNAKLAIGGFDFYSSTEVAKGSGLSSSAAFEVLIGAIMNHFYNDGKVANVEIAKFAQYAENVYFGKPCGLMDQVACAVGGFVKIDFENPKEPKIEPIDFSLTDAGYSLCIVNTGGSHANLNDDYASVPSEMKAVAKLLGREVLREITFDDLMKKANKIRASLGDRAFLRAYHFLRENEGVDRIAEALLKGDVCGLLAGITESGNSSFKYLQNVYSPTNPAEQGLSVGLALTEKFLSGKTYACRVHGGGFAGTIQVFVKNEDADAYCAKMDEIFGDGSATRLSIRPVGAVKLLS